MNDEPTELDLVYEDLRKAQKRIAKLETDNEHLRSEVSRLQQLTAKLWPYPKKQK